jgi:hypothetical protein
MWYQMVHLSGFAPAGWDRPRANGDLLARGEAGIIDTNITELSDNAGRRRSPRTSRSKDVYWDRLRKLADEIKSNAPPVLHRATLPSRPVRLSVHEAIIGLHPGLPDS